MAKTKILSLISALIVLPVLALSAHAAPTTVNVKNWRADCIERLGTWNPSDPSKPIYYYSYRGSMKGSANAREFGNGEHYYSVITLWDIWDKSATPVYFEDFYTYTITFRISFENGEAYFDEDDNPASVGESLLNITSSVYKNEIYGQRFEPDGEPLPGGDIVDGPIANPLPSTLGGYGLPLEYVFENVAVGSDYFSDGDAEVKIVFNTPQRTLEHQWDMLIWDLSMFNPAWCEDADVDYIYINKLEVVYDKDLSAYESAVQEGLTEIGGKIDDLNNTIQQGQDQAHQDAEGIKDAINNQGEKEKNEASSGGNANVAALQSSMGDFDLATYGDAINTLMSSLNYEGTDTTWTLPSSGTVPFLNTTLWKEQEIDLCPDYIVNMESFNLITVFTNFVVAIGCVYVVVNVFNDLLTTMNGAKGDDTKYTEG